PNSYYRLKSQIEVRVFTGQVPDVFYRRPPGEAPGLGSAEKRIISKPRSECGTTRAGVRFPDPTHRRTRASSQPVLFRRRHVDAGGAAIGAGRSIRNKQLIVYHFHATGVSDNRVDFPSRLLIVDCTAERHGAILSGNEHIRRSCGKVRIAV